MAERIWERFLDLEAQRIGLERQELGNLLGSIDRYKALYDRAVRDILGPE